jgi:hypothetical protein
MASVFRSKRKRVRSVDDITQLDAKIEVANGYLKEARRARQKGEMEKWRKCLDMLLKKKAEVLGYGNY